jgi:hypothetical protein
MKVRRDKLSAGFCPAGETGKRLRVGVSGFRETGRETGSAEPISVARSHKTEKAVRQKVEAQLLKLNEDTEYARANDVMFNVRIWRISRVIPRTWWLG